VLADVTTEFFDGLAMRGHEPLLEKSTGTLRFDVVHGKQTVRWFVTVEKGDLTVSRRNVAADLVIRSDRALFEKMVRGKANAMAAMLRGALTIETTSPESAELLVLFQRLLPRPRDARRKGRTAGYARRHD
jgi:predicted lipid carrier protein YhbT